VVSTNCGEIEIALDSRRFPRTVASFVHLARSGLYDGTAVHRVVRGRMVEGGDPTGTGSGGAGYEIVERVPRATRYPRGTVAMARDEGDPPGASSSRFFVVTAADAGLEPEYAVVGRVTGGLDVVRTIDALGDPTGAAEPPVQEIPIVKVTIRRAR
jgi:cyclophilin family peptidyl-prolyl cis-trans isomerase